MMRMCWSVQASRWRSALHCAEQPWMRHAAASHTPLRKQVALAQQCVPMQQRWQACLLPGCLQRSVLPCPQVLTQPAPAVCRSRRQQRQPGRGWPQEPGREGDDTQAHVCGDLGGGGWRCPRPAACTHLHTPARSPASAACLPTIPATSTPDDEPHTHATAPPNHTTAQHPVPPPATRLHADAPQTHIATPSTHHHLTHTSPPDPPLSHPPHHHPRRPPA